MRITATGRVGIGTTSPGKTLEVSTASSTDGIALSRAGSNRVLLTADGLIAWGATANQGTLTWDTNQAIIRAAASNSLVFAANNSSEHARIDTSGRLLVGTSTARDLGAGGTHQFQVEAVSTAGSSASLTCNTANESAAYLTFAKSRAGTIGSNAVVLSGDYLGHIQFNGADGTDIQTTGARISAVVDGAASGNDLPTRLEFSTTADGSASPTERMRIKANGAACIGTTTEGTMSGDTVVAIGPNIGIISKSATGIATSGTVDISISTGGGGYQGFLVVSNTDPGNAAVRTHTTFSVFGRGTDSSIQQIATDNGTTSGASFTVTTPTNGVIRVTNTSAGSRTVNIQFFGGTST
jgi:hypothetical protein